jgi:putative ABC transport system permease protein
VRQTVFAIIGRLAAGVSLQQAKAVVAQQGEQWWHDRRSGPEEQFEPRLVAYPASDIRMPFDPTAAVVPLRLAVAMTVVVTVVLLIAAVNIAGLLIARGVGRTGEVAVRVVVGASGWRIARQLLLESVSLSVLGGIGGFVLARWLLGLFVAYTPNQFAIDVPLDRRVIAFATAICLAIGVGIGLAPALRATRIDLTAALPGSGTGVTKRLRSRFQYWVVIPQVSLALVLLLVAAVNVRSLMNLELTNPGYTTSDAVVLNISLPSTPDDGTTDRRRLVEKEAERSRLFYRQLLGRVQEVTGMAGVALTQSIPGRAAATDAFTAIAQEDFLAGNANGIGASRTGVSPGYFGTMEMTILSGRDFDDRDSRTSPAVAIISAAIAQKLWPGRSAIGRLVAARNNFPSANEKIEWLEVVGVVNEVDPILRDVGQNPCIYISLGQQWRMDARTLVARAFGDLQPIVARLKNAVTGADPLAEVYRVQTMEQVVGEILYPRRMASGILAVAGAIGLVLASLGLYGVVSYSVAQRVHEIGVRAALGASQSRLVRMIVGEGMRLVAAGVAVGFALNRIAVRVTAKMFSAVPPMDLTTMVLVPLILGTVIVLACYIPARRAASVDAMTVLRRL